MGIQIGISTLGLSDRVEFMRTLAAWLQSAGGRMPVAEAIRNTCDAFSRDEYASLAPRLTRMINDFDSGQVNFFRALATSHLGFTKQELTIIEAAERSNQLRVAIPALVEAMTMRLNASRELTRKMMMPLVSGVMLILMTLGVAYFMLPLVIGPVLQRSPEAINNFPFIIQGFWTFSQALRANTWVLIVILLIPPVLLLLRQTRTVKRLLEHLMMNITPVRRLLMAFNGVMIVFFMPALVRSGMPLPQVLRALADSLNNTQVATGLRQAATEHEGGMRLGDALARLPIRSAFRSAVEAGEKTGAIADRVEDLKTPFANDYERITRKFVASLNFVVMFFLLPLFIVSMYTSLAAPVLALMEY